MIQFMIMLGLLVNNIYCVVVVAAGNEGSNGVYSVSVPSTALSALSVASVVNEFYNPPYKLNITGIGELIGN